MTFLQVVNIIRDAALAQPNVNTVVREFLDLNREDTKYSAVVIQDRDGLRDRIVEQDWNTYTFHLGYVDRLTYDESNRDDIFSTGINVINNIVASIREDWPELGVSIVDRFSTFNQRFTASCAGVYVVLAIQVAVSDCVDAEEINIYDKLSINITDNGHYHYVPDGKPYGDIDITVAVPGKPEEKLEETITSNGSYHYYPSSGSVFSDAVVMVSIPSDMKPETTCDEIIQENGSFHYYPESGQVFNDVHITTDIHPSQALNRTYTTNGTKTVTGEWKDGTININVHPSDSLVMTFTSNSTYNITGEWTNATIIVNVSGGDPPKPANDEIYYTSYSNQVVVPYNSSDFGVNLISNTYNGWYGILKFDGPVTKTGLNSFSEKIDLKSIVLPDSVTEISQNSFGDTGLQSLIMSDNVTLIKGLAFSDCFALLTNFRISTGCTEIGYGIGGSFDGCTAMTAITIPASVTRLGPGAFNDCTNLLKVICMPTVPPVMDLDMQGRYSQFTGCSPNLKIYVPAESLQAYKAAAGWSEYADYIVSQ